MGMNEIMSEGVEEKVHGTKKKKKSDKKRKVEIHIVCCTIM